MPFAPALLAAATLAAPPLTLERAFEMAVEANPDVVAARLEIPVADAAVRGAGELPNPTVTGSLGPDSPTFSAGLEQKLPFLGQRSTAVRAAEAERRISEAKLAEAVAKARAEVRRVFATALAAQRRVEIASDVAQLGEGLARAARIRLEQGAGSQLDLLQASLAQHRRAQEVVDRGAELEAARAALATALGVVPADFGSLVAPGPASAGLPSMEQLKARAAHHPRLQVLDAERAAALAAADREQATVVPTPAVSLEYERLPDLAPGYGLRAGLSFDLPVLSWNGGAVAGQRAKAKQVEAEREAEWRRVASGLAAAMSKRAAAEAKAERYERDLVPEAQRLAGMSQLAYQEGKAPLTTALQAQLDLADTRDQAAAAAEDAEVAYADLEEVLGEAP